jgi:hypothetical protein
MAVILDPQNMISTGQLASVAYSNSLGVGVYLALGGVTLLGASSTYSLIGQPRREAAIRLPGQVHHDG